MLTRFSFIIRRSYTRAYGSLAPTASCSGRRGFIVTHLASPPAFNVILRKFNDRRRNINIYLGQHGSANQSNRFSHLVSIDAVHECRIV